jgi:glutathione peroxidase
MKLHSIFLLITMLLLVGACSLKEIKTKPQFANMTDMTQTKSFYDFKLKSLDESEEIDFSKYKGKKVLLVNVASKCGFTSQYEQLQALHEQYGEKLVVLGFPANNFGGQEPGSASEIGEFCQKNYGVTFQMFEKVSVKGGDQHPLYTWLSSKDQNGWNDQTPTWNFCKYLISEDGTLLKFYASGISPMGDEILNEL